MRWFIVLAIVVAFISGCAGINTCFNCHHYTYAEENRT